MKKKPLVYLACPYTHDDMDVRKERFRLSAVKAAELMKKGIVIFSPITMTHPMAICANLPGTFDFWKKFDDAYLSCCNKLIVYRLDGWETSTGVQAEIKRAEELDIPIEYVD